MALSERALEFDAVETVRQLDVNARLAIGYAAARLACAIDATFRDLDKEQIGDLAIALAYRQWLADHGH
jgi:hypothetical protein